MKKSLAKIIYPDPWYLEPRQENPYFHSSHNLNHDIKETAFGACGSVVGILSHLDGANIFRCSGFVVESTAVDGKFISTIFTSASALRLEENIDAVGNNIEISVILSQGITCEAKVVGFDFHYNIAVLKVETQISIPTSILKQIDDSISLDPNSLDEESYDHTQCDRFHLLPGDTVVALGRYSFDKMGLMIVAGEFSVTQTGFECENLFRAECVISRNGIGGPLINRYGEVIGINFFAEHFTPFLPISIVSLWWEKIKKSGHCILPQHGMRLSNLYMGIVGFLEYVMQTFPNTFKGVVVDKVTSESTASTKILPCDIIIECDGKSVGSVLEFSELIWDKVGEPVQLTLLRPCDGSRLCVTMAVGNVGPNQLNRWPLPQSRRRRVRRS